MAKFHTREKGEHELSTAVPTAVQSCPPGATGKLSVRVFGVPSGGRLHVMIDSTAPDPSTTSCPATQSNPQSAAPHRCFTSSDAGICYVLSNRFTTGQSVYAWLDKENLSLAKFHTQFDGA